MTTEPAPSVSVVMIVKNEAANLESALTSCRLLGPLLREVCVYDTGSTDDTVAIARAHGAHVEQGFWDDDFARARNAAAALAEGAWLLTLDGDECLVSTDIAALGQALERPDVDVAEAWVTVPDAGSEAAAWSSPRLYRAASARYTSRIHAHLEPLQDRPLRCHRLPRETLDISNKGFDEARLQGSWRRVIRVTSAVLDDPASTLAQRRRALVDRARARLTLDGARVAIADLAAAEELPPTGFEHDLWGSTLLVQLHLDSGDILRAAEVMTSMVTSAPEHPLTRWIAARVLAEAGHVEEAADTLTDMTGFSGEFGIPITSVVIHQQEFLWASAAGSEEKAIRALSTLARTPEGLTDRQRALLQSFHGAAEIEPWRARER